MWSPASRRKASIEKLGFDWFSATSDLSAMIKYWRSASVEVVMRSFLPVLLSVLIILGTNSLDARADALIAADTQMRSDTLATSADSLPDGANTSAANADVHSKSAESLATNSAAVKKKISTVLSMNTSSKNAAPTGKRCLTMKKVACAILLGCVIATSIAVPVAVHAHHRQVAHRQARRRDVAASILGNQEVLLSSKEQSIRNILAQGATLSVAQRATLQADLVKVQHAELLLNGAFKDVVLNKHLAGFFGAAPYGPGVYDTAVYTLEYDGFADFPRYPIKLF
jgi:hypothetical protein